MSEEARAIGGIAVTTGAFLEAAIRTATPLALAASGELVLERAGMINIGLEGVMLAGAFAAVVGAGQAPEVGVVIGYMYAAAAGAFAALIFAWFTLWIRADQIITGTAVTLLSLGVTGTLYRTLYGASGAALSIPTSAAVPIRVLSRIPVIGAALFDQPAPTYLVYLLIPVLWWWLYGTHSGLGLRAIGEHPAAAEAAGIPVRRMQLGAALFAGVSGGLAGGTLVLAQAGTFAEGMSAGRGFIAIAVVVLGRWHPVGIGLAALLFGAASALQYLFQAMGFTLPYQLFLALPYVLTLAALAGVGGRAQPPATLARIEMEGGAAK
jgi:general nucleoside transport system permease protein